MSQQLLTGSLRLVLVGGVMMMMTTTTTTCLSLVVVSEGEGPMIRLLGLAQVLGQPSPHGTFRALVSQKSISGSVSVSA